MTGWIDYPSRPILDLAAAVVHRLLEPDDPQKSVLREQWKAVRIIAGGADDESFMVSLFVPDELPRVEPVAGGNAEIWGGARGPDRRAALRAEGPPGRARFFSKVGEWMDFDVVDRIDGVIPVQVPGE